MRVQTSNAYFTDSILSNVFCWSFTLPSFCIFIWSESFPSICQISCIWKRCFRFLLHFFHMLYLFGKLSLEHETWICFGVWLGASAPKMGCQYVHPKGTFWGCFLPEISAIFVKIDENGCMCRLGAHTVKLFGARQGLTPYYIHLKYHWLTPNTFWDMLCQK